MESGSILFLDVDGVLNTDMMMTSHPSKLHPKLVKRLAFVLSRTGTRVVVSSTWRREPNYMGILLEYMSNAGCDVASSFVGSTPFLTPLH